MTRPKTQQKTQIARPDTIRGRLGVDAVLADRYEVICRLARGGMGTIYLGRQLGIDRRVAIKVLHPDKRDDPELADLFKREAVAIKHLTHPNTVRLYDFGETESGYLYLVMEYLEGECLDSLLERRGPLPPRLVVHLGTQVLKSLIEANARGIVHRDIKPSNLMLCRQLGETDFIKVLDFGIAWHRLRGAPVSPDKPGEVLGTPRYMSPEQLMGHGVDARSDLYSLGLTLYELACGRPVFNSNKLDRVLAQRAKMHTIEMPPQLAGTRLGRVVSRALESLPEDRFPAAGDMLEALIAAPLPVSVLDQPLRMTRPRRRGEPERASPDTPVGEDPGFDPTLPRVPGQPVTPIAESGPNPAIDSGAVTPRIGPTVAPPAQDTDPDEGHDASLDSPGNGVDEVLAVDHPIAELVRSRFEARLRRRTALTAAVTALLAMAVAAAVLLQVG